MKHRHSLRSCRAALLVVSTLGLMRPAHADEPVSAQVRAQFAAFSAAVGAPAPAEIELQRAPTWVRAASKDWVYTIDLIGNRTFRATQTKEFSAATLRHPAGSEPAKPRVPSETNEKLVARAWELAEKLTDVKRADVEAAFAKRAAAKATEKETETEVETTRGRPDPVTAKPKVADFKQEVLLVCKRDTQEVECFGGRYLVRLNTGRGKFQVVFSADGEVLRIDVNVRDPEAKRLADALANQVPNEAFSSLPAEPGGTDGGDVLQPG